MRYIDAFRDGRTARRLAQAICELVGESRFSFMEVCGTHTVSAFRSGLRFMLPEGMELRSGPGCPVCVTPNSYLDRAIALGRDGMVLATFGDMLRVPGSSSSLLSERARGAKVQVVYSPLDVLGLAQGSDGTVVFLAVGFETTAPAVAATVLEAKRRNLQNVKFLVAHKLIPPAMRCLLEDPDVRIDGFMCPGHVSVIIGSEPYRPLAERYRVPCVITGFEPLDMLQGIYLLARQKAEGRAEVQIAYRRAVRPEGNAKAKELMEEVFEVVDDEWRGLGWVPESGLRLREDFGDWDAWRFPVDVEPTVEPAGCRCGDVLKGTCSPPECPLFGRTCTPEHPIGACMVSSEGACAAWYKYGR